MLEQMNSLVGYFFMINTTFPIQLNSHCSDPYGFDILLKKNGNDDGPCQNLVYIGVGENK